MKDELKTRAQAHAGARPRVDPTSEPYGWVWTDDYDSIQALHTDKTLAQKLKPWMKLGLSICFGILLGLATKAVIQW